MNLAYLACPYKHHDPKVMSERHAHVNQVLYHLMKKGIHAFSPLTHNIPVIQLGLNYSWEDYWQDFDLGMLSRSSKLYVLKLPGWETSRGVTAEIAKAKELNLPIEYLEPLKCSEIESADRLERFQQQMTSFFVEREWLKFHSPKNLVLNLGAELGELMEHFRWVTEEESYRLSSSKMEAVKEEISDVFITLLHLANTLGIDPIECAKEKLKKTALKYPVETCKGQCKKYTEY